MSEEQMIDTLVDFRDHLSLANLLNAPFRIIAWLIIRGLALCVDTLSGALEEIYSVMNFFDSAVIDEWMDKYDLVIVAIASLALLWLGFKIMILNQTDKSKYITNSLLALTLIAVLPWSMLQMEKLVSQGVSLLEAESKKSTKIIQSNMTDIYVLDKGGWKNVNPSPGNYIKSDQSISLLDITETVDTGGILSSSPLSEGGKEMLQKKVNDASGSYKLEDLESNFFTEDEAYYRYSWHPVYMIIELLTVCLVLLFTGFKTTQLIIELGFLKLFTMSTAMTDIDTGQRNKKLVEKIRNTFIILYVIMLLLNFYLIFVDFIVDTDISKPVQIFILLAAGVFVIDGPNIIEELFGIDAGLKSASRSIMGVMGAAKTASMATNAIGKGAKTVGKMAKGTAKGLGKAAVGGATVGAGVKGALDGFKENRMAAKAQDETPLGSDKNTGGTNNASEQINTPLEGKSPLGEKSSPSGSNTPLGAENKTPNGGAPAETLSKVDQSPLAGAGSSNGQKQSDGQNAPNSGHVALGNTNSQNNTPLGGMQEPGSQGNTSPSGMNAMAKHPLASKVEKNSPLSGGNGYKPSSKFSPIRGGASGGNGVMSPRVNMPSYITQAKQHFDQSVTPKPSTNLTLGDAAIHKYAETAQKVYDSTPVQNMRKTYDMSKNSILNNKNGGN